MPRYNDGAVRKIFKIFSMEDSNLEHDIAGFRKRMRHMPAGFIDDDQLNARVNVSVPEHCSLRNSQLGPFCCQEHCVWKTHFNLKHKLEDEDPVHRTVELGSYVESAWEESETCRWDTEDLWNKDIDMEAALGMGHA